MSIGSINNLNNYAILGQAIQGLTGGAGTSSTSSTASQTQPDSGQLSPFAQLLSTLQKLEQSNPAQYQQVTQQIATNLQNAAQTATTDGNTTLAGELNQLATDFTNASQDGQLPNIQDLAQAIGGSGHPHHHHGHHVSSSDSDTSGTSTNSTGTSNTSSPLAQLLAAFQTNGTQSDSLNPLSIITNTLQSAGITIG